MKSLTPLLLLTFSASLFCVSLTSAMKLNGEGISDKHVEDRRWELIHKDRWWCASYNINYGHTLCISSLFETDTEAQAPYPPKIEEDNSNDDYEPAFGNAEVPLKGPSENYQVPLSEATLRVIELYETYEKKRTVSSKRAFLEDLQENFSQYTPEVQDYLIHLFGERVIPTN